MIKVLVFDWGDTLMNDFKEYTGPMAFWPKVELISNIKDSLKIVSNKYICCVCSNAGDSDKYLMEKAFNRAGIDRYFKYFFTLKEIGFSKPDTNFYNEIIRHTGYRPEEHVMIGNDYIKDIVPSKGAGMNTILYLNEEDKKVYKDADLIISDMSSLETACSYMESFT